MNSTPESQKRYIQPQIPEQLLPEQIEHQNAINQDESQPNTPRKVLVIGGIVDEPYTYPKVDNQLNVNSPRKDKK